MTKGIVIKAFADKAAVVTVATSGIGRATAAAFARTGAKVVVEGRRGPEGAETVRLMREVGGEVLCVKTDVSVEAEVEALIQRSMATYGRPDCAFDNAGTIALSPIIEETAIDVHRVMDASVQGVFLRLKPEIPAMLATGGGATVNASSLAGLTGSRNGSVCSASKHATIGLGSV
jgi:NADP-dependent 3-hydroxy acid dehydrogenase YdfG